MTLHLTCFVSQDLLTPAQFDAYLESSLLALLEATEKYSRCPKCSVPIEVRNTQIDEVSVLRVMRHAILVVSQIHPGTARESAGYLRNEMGCVHEPDAAEFLCRLICVCRLDDRPLTPAAQRHFLENRFLCRACDTRFCKSCLKMPYHLGFTCEQYEV